MATWRLLFLSALCISTLINAMDTTYHEPKTKELIEAIKSKDTPTVCRLLQLGTNPNGKMYTSQAAGVKYMPCPVTGKDGLFNVYKTSVTTPLEVAAQEFNAEAIACLLAYGAKPIGEKDR